jgi:CBS domain-containing protein
MFVHQILPLARKRLTIVGVDAPLHEVAKLLALEQINLVVVCDAQGIMAGVINDSDIVHAVCSCRIGCRHACALESGQVMTRDVVSCRTGDTLHKVWSIMKETRLRHIPIVDDHGAPHGVLYARDILNQLYCDLQHEEKMLVDYVMSVGYQ